MTDNDSGKFCPVCKTNVLDFTDLNDNEILEILKQTEGSVCGRFRQSQLNRPLVLNNKEGRANSPRFSKMLMAVALLYSSTNVLAQENNNMDPTNQKSEVVVDSLTVQKAEQKINIKNNVLQGTIFYEQDEDPLVGASVMIKNTNIGVMSDIDGNYKLTIPESLMSKDEVSIVFSFIGCESQTLIYKTTNIPKLKDIYMKEDSSILMGEVMVVPYTKYKDPIYDWKKKK